VTMSESLHHGFDDLGVWERLCIMGSMYRMALGLSGTREIGGVDGAPRSRTPQVDRADGRPQELQLSECSLIELP
jgi:hypothetical protein